MATASAGVVGAVQVNGPLANPSPTMGDLWDPSSGSFWATACFIAAIVILFFVL